MSNAKCLISKKQFNYFLGFKYLKFEFLLEIGNWKFQLRSECGAAGWYKPW